MSAEHNPQPEPSIVGDIDDTTDPATILEWFKGAVDDISEHRFLSAAAAVGAAALVAAVIAKKKGVSLKTPEGHSLIIATDPHAPETVSLVEITEPSGEPTDLAASFPVSAKAAETMKEGSNPKTLFSMGGERGFVYPLRRDPQEVRDYVHTTRKAATWLINFFRELPKEDPENLGQ